MSNNNDTGTYYCPMDGCEYSAPSQHQVRDHIASSEQGEHERYESVPQDIQVLDEDGEPVYRAESNPDTSDGLTCSECGETQAMSELDGNRCRECGEQLMFYPGPTRGSAAEVLAEERAAADTEEEQDVYRAFLHLLACGILTNQDIGDFIYFGQVTENLQYGLGKAYEMAEETDNGDILVCPQCEERIKSWAQWFDPEYENSITPERMKIRMS